MFSNKYILGEEYYEFVDEFMAAIHLRWPRALIQHEDFQTKHAVNLLKRYRSSYLMFNDDIQGTAATTLAGIYGALKGKQINNNIGPAWISAIFFYVHSTRIATLCIKRSKVCGMWGWKCSSWCNVNH